MYMSSIPYNSKAYLDAKVSMADNGTVDAGKQMQSPASAGSRGLAKTMTFSKDKTQMQLGQEAIAESMVEIRSIMNRIDGVNVPTNEMNELADNDKMEFTKLLLDMSVMKDRVQALSVDEDAKASAIQSLTSAEEALVALDETAVKEDAGEDEKVVDMLRKIKQHLDNHPNMNEHPSLVALDQLADDLESGDKPADYESAVQEGHYPHSKSFDKLYGINDKQQYKAMADDAQSMDMGEFMDTYSSVIDMAGDFWEDHQKTSESMEGESAVEEDEGELARLKELSGIKEDAGLTDEQKKGLEAIAKKYKDRVGGNGDMLAYGYLDISDTGIPTDGFDKEEMEAYSKKIGVDWREWDGEQTEDFLDQSETTGGATAFMIDDLIKVLGPEFESDAKLSSRAMDHLDSLDNNYEPFPEGDEFDIAEDEDFEEVLGSLGFPEDETELFDAEYQGRKVPLNKPMRGDSKKFKVYVKDPKTGNVKKVNFGHGGTSAKKAWTEDHEDQEIKSKSKEEFQGTSQLCQPGIKNQGQILVMQGMVTCRYVKS